MSSLSVVVITKNEEANLGRCLESVRWAGELIVVDSGSTDQTVAIGERHGARVIHIEWSGFGPAKREGVKAARGEWILSLDADEEVTPELRREIEEVIAGDSGCTGYFVPRRTCFLGRWIHHCGWYPDRVLRLFRRESGDFDDAVVHERVVVNGSLGHLENDLLHYSYPDLERYFVKFNSYTTIAAEEAFRQGRRVHAVDILARPVANFIKQYFFKAGFLDGMEGLLISVLSSCHVMTKYAKLRHLWRTEGRSEQ